MTWIAATYNHSYHVRIKDIFFQAKIQGTVKFTYGNKNLEIAIYYTGDNDLGWDYDDLTALTGIKINPARPKNDTEVPHKVKTTLYFSDN